jgi:predicted small metal-binding protein
MIDNLCMTTVNRILHHANTAEELDEYLQHMRSYHDENRVSARDLQLVTQAVEVKKRHLERGRQYCLLCGATDVDDWEAHFREEPHQIIVNTNPRNPDGSWKNPSEVQQASQ